MRALPILILVVVISSACVYRIPRVDEPLPEGCGGPNPCGGFGSCELDATTGVATCRCDPNYQDNDGNLTCKPSCDAIPWNASKDRLGNCVSCSDLSGTAICMCEDGPDIDNDLFCPCNGVDTCDKHGSCAPVLDKPTCRCDDGYQDNDNNLTCEPSCATAACGPLCNDSSGKAVCCIVFVDAENTDITNPGGTSWEDAVTSLQVGIEKAAGRLDPDNPDNRVEICDVWVAEGIYQADGLYPDAIPLRSRVHLYGGFKAAGDSSDDRDSFDDRDWDNYKTIIEAREPREVERPPPQYVPQRAVIVEDKDNIVLDGFIIRTANPGPSGGGGGDGEEEGQGGGISARLVSNLTLRNLLVKSSKWSSHGGGVYFDRVNNASIVDSTFVGNQAANGGAIAVQGSSELTSELTIDSCWFANNTSETDGGALWAKDSTVTVQGSTFVGNSAVEGGAIALDPGSLEVSIDDCLFVDNKAKYEGGGGIALLSGQLDVDRARFVANQARTGGAISANSAGIKVFNALFVGNGLRVSGNRLGGAIHLSEHGEDPAVSKLVNSTFAENVADKGTAIATVSDTELTLRNNVITEDDLPTPIDALDSAIDIDWSVIPTTPCSNMDNCKLGVHNLYDSPVFVTVPGHNQGDFESVNNDNEKKGISVLTDDHALWQNNEHVGRIVRVAESFYPVLSNGENYLEVLGTIDSSSSLAYELLDFHLASTSPGIDAASCDLDPCPWIDLDRLTRMDLPDIDNGDGGTPSYADMGCYELWPPQPEQP